MSRAMVAFRALIIVASLGGLAAIAGNVAAHTFYWRARATTLAATPAKFWFLIGWNTLVFSVLLVWGITGAGMKPKRPPSP